MSFDVSANARDDVAAAIRVYNAHPERNGAALLAEVEAAFTSIAATPRLYSPVEDGVPGREFREYFIERFQQRVIYLMTGDDVLVVAVVHATRREGAWHRNLPNNPPPDTT
jgi:plasmid stabilization system protein ParE